MQWGLKIFLIHLLVEVEETEQEGRDKSLLALKVPSCKFGQMHDPPPPPPLYVKGDIFAIGKSTFFSVPCKKH